MIVSALMNAREHVERRLRRAICRVLGHGKDCYVRSGWGIDRDGKRYSMPVEIVCSRCHQVMNRMRIQGFGD